MQQTTFDKYELLAIEAVLAPSEISLEKPGFLPPSVPSKELCLKIGSAMIEAIQKDAAVCVALSEAECWLLRERVNIFLSLGPRTDLGVTLKIKLYALLLEYANEKDIPSLEPVPAGGSYQGR